MSFNELRKEWNKAIKNYGKKRIAITVISVALTVIMIFTLVNGLMNMFDNITDIKEESKNTTSFEDKIDLIFELNYIALILLVAYAVIWAVSKLPYLPLMIDKWFFKEENKEKVIK